VEHQDGQLIHGAEAGTGGYMPAPVVPGQRIISLDVLRGFAILGILIMNIQSFSMISAAYFNPSAYGDLSGVNRWVWILSHMIADTKFISIFSMLFGAGIVLLAERLSSKGIGPAAVHYRRITGLLVIGLMHGFLLWPGDILTAYAIVGAVAFLFWRRSPRTLLIVGLLVTAVSSVLYLFAQWSLPYWFDQGGQPMLVMWRPGAERIAWETAGYTGGWLDQMLVRANEFISMMTGGFWFFLAWRAGGMMLIGMALYKWGVLSAERTRRFYGWMTGIGLAVGYPIIALGVARNFAAEWTIRYSFFAGSQYNYWGSLLVALGYIGLVMLLVKSKPTGALVRTMQPVGRMAFTNYLLQTVLMTAVFYGHGLGLFGQVERWGQVLIVFAVWAFEIWLSNIWLARFRFGPAEWLWRTLTYMRLQPMRRTA
jgi:uncharacterized protein